MNSHSKWLAAPRFVSPLAFLVFALPALSTSAYGQQTVVAEMFVVTSGHPDSTLVGITVLEAGGNVVDAAVATALSLGVAEPYGSGIGGKGMLLYREAASGKVYAIEAMCQAPAALDADAFADRPRKERFAGYTSVAVPGLVAALATAHDQWGSQEWEKVVMPAADLAEQGVVMSEKMYQLSRPKRNLLRRDSEASRLYLKNGETPEVGSKLKNPDLAATLRTIALEGPGAFYGGELAEQVVKAAQAQGSVLSLDDFRDYSVEISEPLRVQFEGYEVFSSPPPLTGGTTVLATLKALDGVAALETAAARDSQYIDLVGRVLLALYPRINRHVADAPNARQHAERLYGQNSVREVQEQARQLDPQRPYEEPVRTSMIDTTADDLPEASTSHLIVADREGNIVCLTPSLSYHFGSCVIAPGTGFFLNNSMSNFATKNRQGVNYVQPGKRERSTIAPIIVCREDQPILALGIPGGQRIPTTTTQLLLDILRYDNSLEEAFARSRFHVRRPTSSSQAPNQVDLENDAPAELDGQLTDAGWKVARHERNGAYFGGGSAVRYHKDGRLEGVADLRRSNHAAGK